MIINGLPLLNASPRRISYAQASSLLVAQALTDANERLLYHFPTLNSATWGDLLRQLQPDLLVDGSTITFDWPGLARRAQDLAAFPNLPALDQPTGGPSAPTLTGQSAYKELAPSLGYAAQTVGLLEAGREGLASVSPVPMLQQKNTPDRATRRNASKRRTFRDIVEHHPRGGGKFGFTVRELCTTMRISADSLTEARVNPGRLSLNAVLALANAMGECPMQVFLDLVAEAGAKNKKKRNKRETPLHRLENSTLK